MECVEPERVDELRAALDELAALLQKYLGAEITAKAIAGRACREIVIQE